MLDQGIQATPKSLVIKARHIMVGQSCDVIENLSSSRSLNSR